MSFPQSHDRLAVDVGTLDGTGAGDHDQPYHFGRRPRSSVPYPFNTRQYARLLILRSRIRDKPPSPDDPSRGEVDPRFACPPRLQAA